MAAASGEKWKSAIEPTDPHQKTKKGPPNGRPFLYSQPDHLKRGHHTATDFALHNIVSRSDEIIETDFGGQGVELC